MTDEQFAWWLVGLVDGEGHFGVTRSTYRPSPFYRCVFRVSMTVADREVLAMAHARTGWGRLYDYDGHGPTQRYTIWTSDMKTVGEIADFFEAHPLQTKKRRDFEIWAPAARAQQQRRYGPRDETQARVMAIAYEGLRALDRGGRRRREAVSA